jgi:hypothetical protein
VWQKTNGTHNRSFFGFRLTNLIFFRRLNVNCSSSSAAAPPPKRAGATEEPDQKSKSCRRSTSLKSHLNTSQNYQTERKRERERKNKKIGVKLEHWNKFLSHPSSSCKTNSCFSP